jgi:hypothetical protein
MSPANVYANENRSRNYARSSLVIGADGTIYVSSWDGHLRQRPSYGSHYLRRCSPASRCSGRATPLGVEGLAIDTRLQRHGRRVAQGGQGEAGRFGHLDQLSHTLGRLVTVERQLGLDRVAHRVRIAGND